MELWFLVKNKYQAKPSLIKVTKTNDIKLVPVIMNEELDLDEIQFSGKESEHTIQVYLSRYFKSVKKLSSQEEGRILLNVSDDLKSTENSRLKTLIMNLCFPGLGFYFSGYPYSGIIIFLVSILGFINQEPSTWILYSLIIVTSLTVKN